MILHFVDYLILALYFVFVIGIGWLLKKRATTASDFLTSGRSLPVWITSLAFIATNLGAQEVIGMCASGAQYGILTVHFYWIGAIPAMIFVGVFMMRFYYASRARSVPEYLKLRYDEKTRTFNAVTFAVLTIFSSGISMYALGRLFELMLGWSFTSSVLLSAAIVLIYTYVGGLTSAIYNEVLQFFLIVLGFAPLAVLALVKAGGWSGIQHRLSAQAGMTHAWASMAHASQNPMGIEVFGMVAGLGFVMSFGYWCTNFLVVQRAMAANSMSAARRTPLVAAFPKMFMPFIVILPGIAAAALVASGIAPELLGPGKHDYNQVMNRLMASLYPSGMLGVGLTALMASFMSGMAGNITAFNTVWTYDIYQTHIRPKASDRHYLMVGRMSTIAGTVLSIACAYVATLYDNIMNLLQLVFGFVNAPLFATFLLGMFWKRATSHGAFSGLLAGTSAALLTHGLTVADNKGGWMGTTLHTFPSSMAQNFWLSIISWTACFVVTIVVSLMTKPKPVSELRNLVWGATEIPKEPSEKSWYHKPVTLAIIVAVICIALNIYYR